MFMDQTHTFKKSKLLIHLLASAFILSSCGTLTNDVTPVKQMDEFTLLIYMAGSDLESSLIGQRLVWADDDELYEWNMCGEATRDIQEILSVPNKPTDVNIIIQTGGTTEWTPNVYGEYGDYDIDATKIQRHHVGSNQKLVLDQTLDFANMGAQETLQSFVVYGLTNYPARRTGLILWGHGGGFSGVCIDSNAVDPNPLLPDEYDRLFNNEVAGAIENALRNTGHAGEKLEFIGYDACYMGLQDVMEFNSHYFKYMIATPEEDDGLGWNYASWIDDLYAKKKTTDILHEICRGYIQHYDYDLAGVYQNSLHYNNTHVIGYYNLLKFENYRRAWEDMAKHMTITPDSFNSFNAILNNSHEYYYCYFDAMSFITALENDTGFAGKPNASYITAVKEAYNLLAKEIVRGQKAYNNSGEYNALSFFFPNMSSSYLDYYLKVNPSQTNFVEWYRFCVVGRYAYYGY